MDLGLGEKWKIYEDSNKSPKKRMDDKTYRVGVLTDDNYNLTTNQMEEVSNNNCKKIDDHNNDLVRGVTYLL